jgi:hypothetical protein
LVGNEVFILTTTKTTRLAGIGDHAVPGPKINSKMQYVHGKKRTGIHMFHISARLWNRLHAKGYETFEINLHF